VKDSCAWYSFSTPIDLLPAATDNCVAWNAKVDAALLKGHFDVIVTSLYAWGMLQPANDQAESAAATQEAGDAIAAAWRLQTVSGSAVLAIEDGPRWADDPTDCLSAPFLSTTDYCALTKQQAFAVSDPQVAVRGAPASLLDLTGVLCPDNHCPAVLGNVTVYRDRHHLTATFATTLAPRIETAIKGLLPQVPL